MLQWKPSWIIREMPRRVERLLWGITKLKPPLAYSDPLLNSGIEGYLYSFLGRRGVQICRSGVDLVIPLL